MTEQRLLLICQKLMISPSTARTALSRTTDFGQLEERLRDAKTFNDAFRVVIEAPIGTHVRIDAVAKALSFCVTGADYKLLNDKIGRGSVQADDLIRHMTDHWDPAVELPTS